MKIAEISTFAQYSVGKIMQDISLYIKKHGGECKIFYFRGEFNATDLSSSKIGNNVLTSLNALSARILDNDGFCLFAAMKRLLAELDIFNPDVIHLHCLHGYSFNVKKLFLYLNRCSKAKIVWTMHDTWAFTGHCCYFNLRKCENWKVECGNCPAKKDYPTSYLYDNSKKNFKAKKQLFTALDINRLVIVSPSLWLKNIISKSFLKKYEVIVINNGINTNIYNESKALFTINKPMNKKMLLAVASVWDQRKGLDRLLYLFSKLQRDDCYLVIIGKLEKKIPPIPNVIHIDRTANMEELKAYYQTADVFINPTLDENYPTVNLEAQACGCKVISSNAGGSLETQRGNLYELDDNTFGVQLHNVLLSKKHVVNKSELSCIYMAQKYYALFLSIMEKDS